MHDITIYFREVLIKRYRGASHSWCWTGTDPDGIELRLLVSSEYVMPYHVACTEMVILQSRNMFYAAEVCNLVFPLLSLSCLGVVIDSLG